MATKRSKQGHGARLVTRARSAHKLRDRDDE